MVNVGHQDGRIERGRHEVAAIVQPRGQLGRVHALRHHVVVAVDVVAVQRPRVVVIKPSFFVADGEAKKASVFFLVLSSLA